MKRALVWFGLLLFTVFSAWGATLAAKSPRKSEATPAVELSRSLAAVTGIAISPLLGTGVYGAYQYIEADEAQRAHLPWFASPSFFIPALVIAGLCAAKDTFGVVFPPGMKKPLDVLEVLENKLSGLLAAGAVVPITLDSLTKLLVHSSGGTTWLHGALSSLPMGAIDFSWALDVVTVPLGVIVFALVWMVSHSINVLILLSPWGAIDAGLKAARLALLGLITGLTHFDPKSGGVLCVIIVVIAYFLAGWAFRLMIFGSIFCWDFFTLRRSRFAVDTTPNRLFSSTALVAKKIPIRTYGILDTRDGANRVFRYRPWLVFPERQLEMTANDVYVGQGVFISTVYAGPVALFTLPPRYSGHEAQFAQRHGMGAVRPAGLRKAWAWLRDAAGLKPQPAPENLSLTS